MAKEFLQKMFRLRNLFVWGNIILLGLFLLSLVVDQKRGWKTYPAEFKKQELARIQEKLKNAVTEEEKALAERELVLARSVKVEIKQIWNQDLDVVDRCITCHLGHDSLQNPALTTDYDNHPFKAPADSPSLEIHKLHDVQKFGCTVCHGGQGFATEVKAAHGQVHHWEKPLLTGTLLQASCAQCHDNLSDLKVKGEIYPSEILRAKKLFREHGCIGCHQIGGEGGPISVDLREETSGKPLSRIDFAYSNLSHEDRTLANWIKIHFTEDPAIAIPGDPHAKVNTEAIPPSAMPPYFMNEEDADALTAYILGLNRSGIPPEYLTLLPPETEPVSSNPIQHGRQVYEKYGCGGCHGSDARGGVRNYNYRYDVTPNLRRAVMTYKPDELKEKIQLGVPFVAQFDPEGPRPPLYMPPWKDKIKGKEMDDLIAYLYSIKE